jgi:glycosyltransferase 2 family protein
MGDYRRHPGTLLRVLMLSFAVQLLRIAQAYVLGLGLGISVPFGYYLAFMPIGLLLLLLPVSISGFGLPQGAIMWMLRPMHVPDPLSFALTTLIVLSGLAGNLPGAWLYLRGRHPEPNQ